MANQIDNDAKVIAGDDYGFGHPAICRLSSTVMFVAHINESDELEIHKSIDDGLNWVLKKSLTSASRFFQLIFMTSTKAALVYLKNANEFEVWVTTDSGENWANKLDITIGVDSNDKAALLYNSSLGRLYVFSHMQVANGYMYNQYSDNDGDTWTGTEQGGSSADLADVDIDLITNYIYVVYFYGLPANNYYRWFNSSGTLLGTSANLGEAGNTYHDKNFAIDSVGNRYFVYIKNTTATLRDYLMVRRNEGAETQLFYVDVDSPQIIKGSTSIGIDEDDNVFVYYTKTSDEKTYYRKYNAGTSTWEAEVELIAVANNRINCEKHILALSNKLHFVYYQAP